MAEVDLGTARDLIQSVGPTDEHRQKFGQSFLGTLLGQTLVLVGMLLTYIVVVVLLAHYSMDKIIALHDKFGAWFWIGIAVPFVCILLFSMLPTLMRALRERRMKIRTIGGGSTFTPGYFRLHPYAASDRESFKRLDGEDAATVTWLRTSKQSLLYLSGSSGVGKSSLLAAGVLPKLRDEGWAIVETRVFGDPENSIREALLESHGLFARTPAADLPLKDILKRAADGRLKAGSPPVLLVIDQFEEFLILHDADGRRKVSDLLLQLDADAIPGLKVLLVFRSDYRPLVFKLGLPALSEENWRELSPYDRGEAATFLQSGGRDLAPETLDALFNGLDRIEEARGIYRPITLNMVGLVLERMGKLFHGDPGRLIQAYLANCLTAGESRDFAKPLLAAMITDAGTKDPISEADLCKRTGYQPWQVGATLSDLRRQGLVRPLEGGVDTIWEVSHDFLARAIGQLIGRLKPTPFQRARPLIAPTVLVAWLGLAALLIALYLPLMQQRKAEVTLRELGASIGQAHGGGLLVSFAGDFDFDSAGLVAAQPHLVELNDLASLDLGSTGVADIEPLTGLTSLAYLNLGSTGVADIEPLKGLTSLTTLDLGSTRVVDIEPLNGLTGLTTLDLSRTGVADVEPLKGLTGLTSLYLGSTRVADAEPLKRLTSLTTLDLSRTGVADIEALKGLTSLTTLDLSRTTVADIEPLRGLISLTSLYLGSTRVADVEPLKGLTSLTDLNLGSTRVADIEPLKGLTSLTDLNLGSTRVADIEPLKGLTNLTDLYLTGTKVTDLGPVRREGLRVTGP